MKFHSSAVAMLAAVLLAPTASAEPSKTSTQLPWQYVVDSDDGTLYFGRNIRHYDGITFLNMKTEADPEGGNGDDNAWVQPFRCDARLIKTKSGEWDTIAANTVGEEWLKFACKGRTKLSDRKGVDA